MLESQFSGENRNQVYLGDIHSGVSLLVLKALKKSSNVYVCITGLQ